MRVVLFITFVFFVELAYGQSKKEQIEILNYRIDSLKKVMDVENNKFILNKTQFEIQISNIRNQIMFLDSNLIILKQELSNKQNELNSSKISISDKSAEIKLLEKNINEKQGSIDLLNSEIENLKSTLALQNQTEISEDVSLLNQNNTVSIKSEIWEKTNNNNDKAINNYYYTIKLPRSMISLISVMTDSLSSGVSFI
jgi:chromosome segregation ATPase